MNPHHPECVWKECLHTPSSLCRCGDCICQQLRACEQRTRDEVAEEIARAHQRATYDPHGRDEGCEDCNIWYRAYDIAKGVVHE